MTVPVPGLYDNNFVRRMKSAEHQHLGGFLVESNIVETKFLNLRSCSTAGEKSEFSCFLAMS